MRLSFGLEKQMHSISHGFIFNVVSVISVCLITSGPLKATEREQADRAFDKTASRPNILYFYVDDMGWGSIGPNGQAERRAKGLPYVRTPNIDRLAAAGVNFRRGYACHVCSPSRASQQTGFHQGHAYADRNDPNNARKAIRADDVTIGDALSQAGYVTGYWGKWGYGGSKDPVDPTIDNVQTLPTSHGYQHVLAELHHVRAHTFFQPTLWSAPAPSDAIGGVHLIPNSLKRVQRNISYPTGPALQNHSDYPKVAYCDDSYAFAALDFVRQQSQKFNETKQPFFGLLAVQIPHAPFGEITQLPEWDRAYRDDPHFAGLSPQAQQWAAMVTRIDAHFGNILAALRDPNGDGDQSDSVENETLVVFQSDNGGPGGKNDVELDANGGLRGNKGMIQEGGIRVPLVMRWPEMIDSNSTLKAGSNSDRIVDITDLLPTFCELAGAETPVGIDGVSIAPTLTGRGDQRPRDFLIHEAGNGTSIIRGNLKLVRSKKGQLALYDLSKDHHEDKNIAGRRPQVVRELESLLIGERVLEPKGFAATYHSWEGGDGGVIDADDNWSNYVYSNAGITYTTAAGTPKPSWIARIASDLPASFEVIEDTNFLALVIGGRKFVPSCHQVVFVQPDTVLFARNELRVSRNGELRLENGTAKSLRWVDVQENAELSGNGRIDATLYNSGKVATGSSGDGLTISRDYRQSESGHLQIRITKRSASSVLVKGTAVLSGSLSIQLHPEFAPEKGRRYQILAAETISGRFQNKDDIATTNDGSSSKDGPKFKIHHSKNLITAEVL